MLSNRKMASAPVNSDSVDTATDFERQKKEIKELLDTQLVEGDAWYIYNLGYRLETGTAEELRPIQDSLS